MYPFHSLLPPEEELAAKFGVSRPTIAKVYNTLQDENYVFKRKGVGTRVIFKKNKNSLTFGLLLPGAGESEIFSIINNRFLEHSLNGEFECLWDGTTAGNADTRKEWIEIYSDNYISKKVDGVFFAPLERVEMADDVNKKICDRFTDAGIPLILIDRDIVEFPHRSIYDLISLDNFNAGYTMAEHLLDSNCTTIHFVYRQGSAFSVTLRRLGVAAAVHRRGLIFTNDNVYCGNLEDAEFVKKIKINPAHTGIICANDSTAAVLMSTMDSLGIKISEDTLICGFDDMKYASLLKYPLTSYSQPCIEIADIAIEMMLRRIKNEDMKANYINLTGEVIFRQSSVFRQ
jgi:LacI family transcriptional regulator